LCLFSVNGKATTVDNQKLKYLASIVTPRPAFAAMETLYHVTMIMLGWWSLPLELFLRKEFGERYLSLLRIWIAWMLLGTFTFFYSLFAAMAGDPMAFFAYSGMTQSMWNTGMSGLLYHLFYYAFILLAIWHRYRIWKRGRDGQPWLSICFGVSHLEMIPWQRLIEKIPYAGSFISRYVTIDDYFLYRFLEPVLCLLLGRLIHPVDGFLGTFITISAVALFVKNAMVYNQMRGQMLDMMDAAISSSYLAEALKGRAKEQTAGFSVIPLPLAGLFEDELDLTATVQDTLGLTASAD
jgi:hypothetical protein